MLVDHNGVVFIFVVPMGQNKGVPRCGEPE